MDKFTVLLTRTTTDTTRIEIEAESMEAATAIAEKVATYAHSSNDEGLAPVYANEVDTAHWDLDDVDCEVSEVTDGGED